VDRAFAAPEQIAYPNVADPKSDLFSSGALLYYMLTGRPPFDRVLPGSKPTSAFDRQFSPPQSFNAAVPDTISRVVEQAMSEYSRFNTCQEMRRALDEAARLAQV
jgi:serine/threonine-protein kinase